MSLAILLATIGGLTAVQAFNEPTRFLIASAPRNGRIAYLPIPEVSGAYGQEPMFTLITGLSHPQGLAVDQPRRKLYVADPDTQKILSYELHVSGNTLSVGPQSFVVENVESRWVAVDGVGTLYMTDEPRNQILKLTPAMMAQGIRRPEIIYNGGLMNSVSSPGGIATDNFQVLWANKDRGVQVGTVMKAPASPATALMAANATGAGYEVLHVQGSGANASAGGVFYFSDLAGSGLTYDAAGTATVTAAQYRGGQLLWTGRVSFSRTVDDMLPDAAACPSCNSRGRREPATSHGQWEVGDRFHIVRGSAGNGLQIGPVASNSMKAYDLCLALDNVYFSDETRRVYGVKKTGGEVVTITDQLANPRGLVYDFDGTVYVADRTANAIYQFAGNMRHLSQIPMIKAADFEDAFGLAVFLGM